MEPSDDRQRHVGEIAHAVGCREQQWPWVDHLLSVFGGHRRLHRELNYRSHFLHRSWHLFHLSQCGEHHVVRRRFNNCHVHL